MTTAQYAMTQVPTLANRIRGALLTRGGITLDPTSMVEPTSGYAVSVRGAEATFASVPTHGEVSEWLRGHGIPVALIQEKPSYFGAWVDKSTGKVFLDVTVVVPTRSEAEVLGRKWGQLAVFDLGTGEEYRLN